jgi:glycerol-1-phosphate dehydrogenase [NAD(P)+]
MINAGVGDVLGKYTALIDWRFSRIVNGEYVCDATVDNVRKALDLVSSNAEAIASREPEAVLTVMEGLLLTGIAMAWIGNSRPASGCEHHMSHFLEMRYIPENRRAVFHGTKVGIGTIIALRAYEYVSSLIPDFDAIKSIERKPFAEWEKDVKKAFMSAAPEIIELENAVGKNDVNNICARLEKIEDLFSHITSVGTAKKTAENIEKSLSTCAVFNAYSSFARLTPPFM